MLNVRGGENSIARRLGRMPLFCWRLDMALMARRYPRVGNRGVLRCLQRHLIDTLAAEYTRIKTNKRMPNVPSRGHDMRFCLFILSF